MECEIMILHPDNKRSIVRQLLDDDDSVSAWCFAATCNTMFAECWDAELYFISTSLGKKGYTAILEWMMKWYPSSKSYDDVLLSAIESSQYNILNRLNFECHYSD